MENIEGLSYEEFDYMVNHPNELNIFMQNPNNKALLTEGQLTMALLIIHE